MFKKSADASSAAAGHGRWTIARMMLIAGAVIIVTVTASSLFNREAFLTNRIGSEKFRAIINGHDLVADYLPPPLLPYEALMMAHETAATQGVNLDKQIARWKDLHKEFNDRMAFWDQTMKNEPFLDQEKWLAFRTTFDKYGKLFWDTLEKSVIPALQTKDKVQIETTVVTLTAYFRQFVTIVGKQDDFVYDTIAERERVSLADSDLALLVSTGSAAFLGAFLALVLFAGQRYVVRAITSMSSVMTRLAGGELEIAVPFEARKDEVGSMARAVTVFKQQAQINHATKSENEYVIRELGAGLEDLSRGDLTHKIVKPFPPALDALRLRFNQTVDALQAIIAHVRRGTDGIKSGTEEISVASDDLSRRTENQAANLEETAAAVAEITAKVKQAANGAINARTVVSRAKEEADHSGEVVNRAVGAMREIEETSRKISQIIGVMDEIAFQTNLLALNAGVEAARAGDAGRGFAVVASEVRALAQRSAEAAKEIKGLLTSSQTAVEQGVGLVAETGTSLTSIIKRIAEINEIVAEIAESAEYQATGLQEVNTAVEQMDMVTQQNAAMVEETTAATRTLTEQSIELAKLVAHFTVTARDGARDQSKAA
ncbi:methyl-accepting chemotaxis protein [Aestuariivirga sp.]|uniref:methyl-accepting chemotaxis protein n=1 Tax=Aestuariivirga sp. TaxID=2650926 RepID=UPI0039E2F9A4